MKRFGIRLAWCGFVLFFALNALFGKDSNILEVSALHFSADEKSGIIELTQNVEIKKGKDELSAPKVVINIDKNRTPLKYSAFGGVKFAITTNDNRLLKGSADEVNYNPQSGEYRLKGNAKVNEEDKINSVVGDEIIINNAMGFVNILGRAGKPAKLIFKMEDKDSRKDNAQDSGDKGSQNGNP